MKALSGTADGVEQLVFDKGAGVFDDRDPLLHAEVVAEDSGPIPSPLVIGSSDQFIEEVSS